MENCIVFYVKFIIYLNDFHLEKRFLGYQPQTNGLCLEIVEAQIRRLKEEGKLIEGELIEGKLRNDDFYSFTLNSEIIYIKKELGYPSLLKKVSLKVLLVFENGQK